MPDVLHNKQTEVVFMPETHLPKIPRVVDKDQYEKKKANLSQADLDPLGIKSGPGS